MNTLKFNYKFDNIVEEPLRFWKTSEDIPKNIKEFINEVSNSIPLFDQKTKIYYCPKCLKEIKQKECTQCSRKFDYKKILKIDSIENISNCTNNIFYYVFDIIDNNILLYLIHEYVDYNSIFSYYPYKKSEISIDAIYEILPTEIIKVKTNEHISYKKIEEIQKKLEIENEIISDKDFSIYEEFELIIEQYQFLYLGNLEDLKNTKVYKDSNIWILKDYYNNSDFNLSSLTYYPIYLKEFSYLTKLGFYELAINSCPYITYNGSFKNTFGVGKEYYPFMKNIDISYVQLEALNLYSTTDINLLNFISDNYDLVEFILNYVSLNKVLDYFKLQKLEINNLYEYSDYIKKCIEMNLNLKDNNTLFPNNFIMEYNKIGS